MPKLKILLLTLSIFTFKGGYSNHKAKEKPFTIRISGTVKNFQGNTIYLHHRWDDKDHTDSAKIEKGQFSFKLQSIDPNMYWFTTARDLNSQPNAIFFADAAPIKVALIGDSIASAVIEGGQTQKDYLDYKNNLSAFTAQQQKLQADYTLASQKGDRAEVSKIQQDYQNLGVKYVSGLKDFVKTHPKSAVSGYIIYKEFNNPNIPIENAIECLGYIDKSIENTKFIRLATKKVNELKGTMIGSHATNFSQNTPDGHLLSLSDFKGKYLLVDFWASWCRPCRMENPNVVSAYNRFKDKGFTVLSVSLDSNREQWLAAIATDHLSWANVSDLKGGSNEAAVLYGIQNIPQNVLIDREGKIVAKNLRGPALEEKLLELIK